jgi:Flp pilus assembly protein TadB
MSSAFILAFTAGALAGGGVLLAILLMLGVPIRGGGLGRRLRRTDLRRVGVQAGVGIGVGLVVLVISRWVVLALAVGGLAASWRRIFGGAAEERSGIGRLDALASWTESLRDTIAGAAGLEQAIPATSATAAPALRPALNLLVDRLRIREPLPDALLRFADDIADPSADLVISTLVLNSRLRGPGLRDVLGALAASAREELDMRRRISASRRSTRRSVQIVVAVTLGVAAMLIVLNRTYVKPYETLVGQFVLVIVIALFAAGVLWLRRLARVEMPGRFLRAQAGRGRVAGAAGTPAGVAVGAGGLVRVPRYAAIPTAGLAGPAGGVVPGSAMPPADPTANGDGR